MVFFRQDDEGDDVEEGLEEDEDTALADEVLDQVEGEGGELSGDDTIEGFGLVTGDETEEFEEEEEEEEDKKDDERLEEDAEEVDFDNFDDVDEL